MPNLLTIVKNGSRIAVIVEIDYIDDQWVVRLGGDPSWQSWPLIGWEVV